MNWRLIKLLEFKKEDSFALCDVNNTGVILGACSSEVGREAEQGNGSG